MKNYVTKEDINYGKNTLKNYFYAKKKEMYYRRLAFELEDLIEDERSGSGISYEQTGNGCSASYPQSTYVDQLINEQAGYDIEAAMWEQKHKRLDKLEKIEQRLANLPNGQRNLIYAVCRDNKRNEEVSKDLYKGEATHQTVSDRLNAAIEAFLVR